MADPGKEFLMERANFPKQDNRHYGGIIEAAFAQVVRSGQTILADGVRSFEAEFASWLGGGLTAEHCIGVGNGTDALELAMRCAGVEPGTGVIVPSLTPYATVAAILRVGAHPVFVDVEALRPVIAVAEVERLLAQAGESRNIRAVIAVHLYGEACELSTLCEICNQHGVALIEDCAQATGTTYKGSVVGTWGDYAAFSFYPTKNLAALGDGGMLVVGKRGNAHQLKAARQLRFYGWDEERKAVQFGVNSRLDEVQAWILKGKLADLAKKVEARRKIASLYDQSIQPWAEDHGVGLPMEGSHWNHSYHLYVTTVDPRMRNEIVARGQAEGIPYSVHYSLACHQHPYLSQQPCQATAHLPHSERLAASVLTLPLNPYLEEEDVLTVSSHLRSTVQALQEAGV